MTNWKWLRPGTGISLAMSGVTSWRRLFLGIGIALIKPRMTCIKAGSSCGQGQRFT